eukprot:NODE_1464_length_1136_cov_233.409806.p1 GENE.NODE_1464_length_1136_cov_233.409806~~NODE_1464_length_1136_cov_233.409806.p1  ORF type:complete len:343 (-),score=66.76 NODE_1464_length_1136_cov_233.409806:90-1118(-)
MGLKPFWLKLPLKGVRGGRRAETVMVRKRRAPAVLEPEPEAANDALRLAARAALAHVPLGALLRLRRDLALRPFLEALAAFRASCGGAEAAAAAEAAGEAVMMPQLLALLRTKVAAPRLHCWAFSAQEQAVVAAIAALESLGSAERAALLSSLGADQGAFLATVRSVLGRNAVSSALLRVGLPRTLWLLGADGDDHRTLEGGNAAPPEPAAQPVPHVGQVRDADATQAAGAAAGHQGIKVESTGGEKSSRVAGCSKEGGMRNSNIGGSSAVKPAPASEAASAVSSVSAAMPETEMPLPGEMHSGGSHSVSSDSESSSDPDPAASLAFLTAFRRKRQKQLLPS